MTGPRFLERRPNRIFNQDEIDFVTDEICRFFKVEEEALYTKFKGNVAHIPAYRARQTIMYVGWMSYDSTQEGLGSIFSVTNVTAHKATINVEEWREDDRAFNTFLTKLEDRIIQRRLNRGN